MLRFSYSNTVLILLVFFCTSCSVFNQSRSDNFDCAKYDIFHDKKIQRKSSAEINVAIKGTTRYCDNNSLAKGTIVRVVDQNDKVILHTISDNNGNYSLICKSGVFKISAVNPGGGVVETGFIDFGLYSMSTKINLYMQHPNAFIEKMEDPRLKKN